MDSRFDTEMLAAIRPLREAGFALHWLHPKSKRPIGGEWSTATVQTIGQLLTAHARRNNLGVRLGEPSLLVSGHYLYAFDIDIRIAELAHEAWERLGELLGDIDIARLPAVASGSGGESRHRYFTSDKAFYGKKLAVSEGKHRGSDGKWHYDWEIELFGTGKQVVLPPSIHPDTGQPYSWERPFPLDDLSFGGGPFISSAKIDALQVASTATYEFETRDPLTFKPDQMERTLDDLPIERLDDYHDWVMLGQALHHQFGADQAGFDIWVACSKRSAKFDDDLRTMRQKWRGFGRSRRQPVTMATVVQWAGEARTASYAAEFDDFGDEVEPDDAAASARAASGSDFDDLDAPSASTGDFDDLLSAAPAGLNSDLAALDLGDDEKLTDWRSLFDYNEDGGLRGTLHNLELLLKNDPRFVGLAQLNDFTHEVVQRTSPGIRPPRRKNEAKPTKQLSGRVWTVRDGQNGDLWSEDRDFAIRAVIEAPKTQGGYSLKVTDRDLKAGISLAADGYRFHPVREYLEGSTWDGEARVERLWIDYVGSPDDEYHREVARLMMVAAVTRIFEPGHKFDFATILEGLQGKRKSTLIEVLGRRWFAELDGDFHNSQQMVELMQGAWIMEIPELTGFGRSDVRAIKAFISRKKDRVRLAYARRAGEYPRQVVFLGSTNDDQYLRDDTGGRRFWPVKCDLEGGEIDTERLEQNIDQMWAEAVALYRAMRAAQPHGTLPLYLRGAAARDTAARLQESRRIETASDALAGKIEAWLDAPLEDGGFEDARGEPAYRNETCTAQIWVECMHGDLRQFRGPEQAIVNNAMKCLRTWFADGSQMRFGIYGKQRAFYRGGVEGRLERMHMEVPER